jgi:O-acetyl-ADP-ribose deacetylase (regulator of RNase III)
MKEFIDGKVKVITGDITKQDVDAIVNAANSSLMGGGGVDGAIHKAGGENILEECKLLRKNQYPSGLPTGEAVMTTAGDMKAKAVIQTVGPVYDRDSDVDISLANCYKNSIELLVEKGYKTIAFPAISTGIYGYPKDEAAKIASKTIETQLKKYPSIEEVRLVFFSDQDKDIFLANNEFS